jgi:hypothetical protein
MLGPVGNVSVSLLGGFAAAVDGVQVPERAWRLKKARELVKLLALAPGHHLHREQRLAKERLRPDERVPAKPERAVGSRFLMVQGRMTVTVVLNDYVLQHITGLDELGNYREA